MAFPFNPHKRPYERSPLEPIGRRKWQKTAPPVASANESKVLSDIVFRVLCPASKTGSVIGKGGSVVSKIEQETGSKIKIEEPVPGCDERVIVITVSEKEVDSKEQQKEDGGSNNHGDDNNSGDAGEDGNSGDAGEDGSAENGKVVESKDDESKDDGIKDAGNDIKASDEKDEKKEEGPALETSKSENGPASLAQKAVMLVFERIFADEIENDDEGERTKKSTTCVRLLILSAQVGCLLGVGGSVIKQMSSDSGAQIRILPKDKLPSCAAPSDEIVQIMGELHSIRKGIQLVSQQLLENPSRERDLFPSSNSLGPPLNQIGSFSRPEATRLEGFPPANHPFPSPSFANRPFDVNDHHPSMPRFPDHVAGGPLQVAPEQLTFRLLCSNDRFGSVIGKGGGIIKALQHETGCEIKVLETKPESDDRIIVISGPALPEDAFAPPQEAIFRVQERIVMAADNVEDPVILRLLVSTNQTGCILGKGGSVISEMRKVTGAHIRVLGKDQLPNGVPENDEIVQVTGEPSTVHYALVQITTRLKYHLFRDKLNHMGRPGFIDPMLPPGPFIGRGSPPRMYHFDSAGRPIEERRPFPIHNSGVPPHGVERLPPAPWAPQGIRDGVGPLPFPDYMGGPPHRGGFPGGNQPGIITNTTVDVVIPRALVPSIYGEEGGCLKRIREISEAKITITEPRPEATETVIIISGTPEQTHAAQSLIQAFVMCGPDTP